MKPELVDGDVALLFELIRPLSTMFVLLIFPFGADTFLEEVVVGFEGEFRGGSNVVLQSRSVGEEVKEVEMTYIYTPEFLNRVERNDFLKEIIPVVTLQRISFTTSYETRGRSTFPLGGLVNHKVHLFMRGCLTLKLSLS